MSKLFIGSRVFSFDIPEGYAIITVGQLQDSDLIATASFNSRIEFKSSIYRDTLKNVRDYTLVIRPFKKLDLI